MLYSHGQPVTYSVNDAGSVLTATGVGGVVFTLTVNPDGSWAFDLDDQLDHVDDGANSENHALRTSADGSTSVSSIDFSSIIVATDFDGDSLDGLAPGSFAIAVQDDVPVISIPRRTWPELIADGAFANGFMLNGDIWNSGSGTSRYHRCLVRSTVDPTGRDRHSSASAMAMGGSDSSDRTASWSTSRRAYGNVAISQSDRLESSTASPTSCRFEIGQPDDAPKAPAHSPGLFGTACLSPTISPTGAMQTDQH